jgi:superfamily II RNA helicase
MPARTACFASLRKFDGVKFDYMKRRDYLQMAGRAGRQGIDKEGLVFSVLDTEDLLHAPLKRVLFGTPEPILSRFNLSYSTLINLYSHMGRGLVEAYEKSFSWFELQKGSQKKRQTLRNAERARILRKIHVLEETGYLDEKEGLLPRAKIARQINGYEIQLTELLFHGALDSLKPEELSAVVVSIVYEERRGDEMMVPLDDRSVKLESEVELAIRRFTSIEVQNGFEQTIKLPSFRLYPATIAWCQGCEFADLGHYTSVSAGDLVRAFRMAIQMLRQLQHALSKDYPLHHVLETARVMLNRDVVDAKRQLELG